MGITDIFFMFLFLPFALLLYYIIEKEYRQYCLLVISILFYMFGAPESLLMIIISIILNCGLGYLISNFQNKKKAKLVLIAGIIYNVGILFFFKYYNFVLSNVVAVFHIEFKPKEFTLPLGLSFFTFKAISYLIDVYKGKIEVSRNLVCSAVYLSFFPQITSGPLSRYEDMWGGTEHTTMTISDLKDGIYRFMCGFSKKVFLANMLANITSETFSVSGSDLSVLLSWLGAICFSLQLYYDFSGYSDMAIGITQMFGYECPENFNYPYMTKSISEFWRRWHITLGAWFRDYIYFPLGGSRVHSKLRLLLNLLVVWVLTGIWHGANWNFVCWGIIYFVLISFEKLTRLPTRLTSKISKIIYQVITLLLINFAWVIFKADSLKAGLIYVKSMFVASNSVADFRAIYLMKNYCIFIIISILLCFPIVPYIEKKVTGKKYMFAYEVVRALILSIIFVLALAFVIAGNNNPFAYANF